MSEPVQKSVQNPNQKDDKRPSACCNRPAARFLPMILSLVGALLLLASLNMTWWGTKLVAPQYPQGLVSKATLQGLVPSDDKDEIEELNHYIGMMDLDATAKFEKAMAPIAIPILAALALVAAFVKWPIVAWVLRLPAISVPIAFLADLKYWLWYAGHHLDPEAPFSAAIKGSLDPVLLGGGQVAQFYNTSWVEPGWYAATVAAICFIATGVIMQKRRRLGV